VSQIDARHKASCRASVLLSGCQTSWLSPPQQPPADCAARQAFAPEGARAAPPAERPRGAFGQRFPQNVPAAADSPAVSGGMRLSPQVRRRGGDALATLRGALDVQQINTLTLSCPPTSTRQLRSRPHCHARHIVV